MLVFDMRSAWEAAITLPISFSAFGEKSFPRTFWAWLMLRVRVVSVFLLFF
jgi:hypothetical protein